MGAAIKLSDVSKYYRLYDSPQDRVKESFSLTRKSYHKKHYALKGIDLDIGHGDILGVVGKNGCGKSTLLKLITGVLQPNSGEIEVNGQITALLELGAGFNPEFTGRENIKFYASVLGLSQSTIDAEFESILSFADLGIYIDQPVKTYSSGMRARLGFSVAVHVQPDILILDEVLSVGDALFQRKCFAKMEEFFNAGKTIIFVSHDTNSVRRLCNRAVFLHDSRIVMDGDASDVTKFYEKMLFAKQGQQQAVLDEIARFDDYEDSAKQIPGFENGSSGSKPSETPGSTGNATAFYLEGFESEPLSYESYPIRIENCRFLNKDHEHVNVLVSGEEYLFKYEVIFNAEFENVSFNMMIKTLDGVKVFGVTPSKERNYIDKVVVGQRIEVEWPISNLLVAGDYLTNAGVMSIVGGELTFLARMVDASIFKVIGSKASVSGYVDLQSSSISISTI